MRTPLIMISFIFSFLFLTACSPGVTTPTDDFSYSGQTITTPTYGSGNHTITIYTDYQCPACFAFHSEYDALLHDYANQGLLKVEYKQLPLYPRPHQNSLRDAYAALCAHEQGKFREFSEAMYPFEEGKKNENVSDAERGVVAQGAGIPNIGAFHECLAKNTYAKQVALDRDEANSKNITYTPSVFLDGVRIESSLYSKRQTFMEFLEKKLKGPGEEIKKQ